MSKISKFNIETAIGITDFPFVASSSVVRTECPCIKDVVGERLQVEAY